MAIIWILISIFLLLVEFMTVKIIYIWYSLSALISLIIAFNNKNFLLQFILFIVLGMMFNILFRDKLIKYLKNKKVIINTDKLIGKECIVTKEIKEFSYGEVKVNKKKWAAYSNDHLKIDSKAIVEKIEGVRLKVRKK